ncbi:MAG: sugar transferase [Actinomycetota bacterium]|nr:sugar transferase [Actinomycetota bacterium]
MKSLPLITAATDAGVLILATVLAVLAREHAPFQQDVIEVQLAWAPPMIMVTWLATLAALGSYQPTVLGAGAEEYRRTLSGSLVTAALVGVGAYLLQFQLSRGFFLLLFGLGFPLLLIGRYLVRRSVHAARRRGAMRHRVILAGSTTNVDEVVGVLRRQPWLGYDIVGALTPSWDESPETRLGVPVLGDVEDATALAVESEVDVIFFAGGAVETTGQLRRAVWDLEHHDVQVVVAPSVADISSERVTMRPIGGLPLMHIDSPRWIRASRWGKRTFDVISSALIIVMILPLLALIAAAVKASDRGPVLFRQTRIGRDGREFACLKFRSMVVDAEVRLENLHREHGYEKGLFKVKDDPRITGTGRILRRLSLDELPQLVNVLRGEMSLVGPRPPLPTEVAAYEPDTLRRLHVRPGITGLWQVSGRSDLSWDETVRLDLYYIDNWSMMQDLSILAKTLHAVAGKRGAY